ncbi:L,D-transpeptidase family protein, partial [Azospirillum sp. RWY-5-1]|nr:L,D-transpeptidase family protein [Azospirillum oleiclasticum]
MLSAWADRLDARAAELEAMAPVAITRVGPGGTLKKGASGERTSRLIQRLIELGYLTPEQRSASFDDLVDTAVRSFQTASNMTPDGLVGTGTQQALDRSPAEAAGIMRHTATSMRALRDEQLPDAVLVNLPSQTVTLVRDSARVFDMRAVVGRPSRETPLLRDRITHVIVNPTWTVPPTVLKED